jgi:PKD repeat protein
MLALHDLGIKGLFRAILLRRGDGRRCLALITVFALLALSGCAKKPLLAPEIGPSADFIGEPRAGPSPLAVDFTDKSTTGSSSITSWLWMFGDGATSTDPNPSHSYADSGTYTVSLRVATSVGIDTLTKFAYIVVSPTALLGPRADFIGTPRSGSKPLTVQFTDQSTNGSEPITSWSWTFGDGATSTARNPSHTYNSGGTYTVSLTVQTSVGSDTETMLDFIDVRVGPTAEFVGSPRNGIQPLAVQFTDQSIPGTSSITSWSWAFGDGGTSTAQSPSHTYTAAGTYTVSLTVTTAEGSATQTKSDYIVIGNTVPPTAAFSGAPTSGTTPLAVQFTDESTAGTSPITSWAWTFGDGGTSAAQSPSHTYTSPGTYSISLTVTSSVGSDAVTKANYITAAASKVPPTADFSGSPTSGLAPLAVQFTDQSTAGSAAITSWAWTFGDGGTSTAQSPSHAYPSAGTYTVSLRVTTADGSDGETKTGYITVNPRAGPTAAFSGSPTSGLSPLAVQFTDQSTTGTSQITSWAWTFGDGETSTSQNPSHTYTAAGTYTVSLTVTTADGSDGETKTGYITVNPRVGPTAAFSGSPTSGAPPLVVQFTDESTAGTSPITSWAWTFGDGGTSTAQSPSHTYLLPGAYTVSITVTTSDGTDAVTKVDYITATLLAPEP